MHCYVSYFVWSIMKRHSCSIRGRSTCFYRPSPGSQFRESIPQNGPCDRGRKWDSYSWFRVSKLTFHTSRLLPLALLTAVQKTWYPPQCCAFNLSLGVARNTWNSGSAADLAQATRGWHSLGKCRHTPRGRNHADQAEVVGHRGKLTSHPLGRCCGSWGHTSSWGPEEISEC